MLKNKEVKISAILLAVVMLTANFSTVAANAEGAVPTSPPITSEPLPEVPAPMGSSPYVTGYTVQTSAGVELQRFVAGEKAQLVIGVCDPRYNTQTAIGNFVSIKVASNDTFLSPSLGDIYHTGVRDTANGLTYSVVFNDITYIGGDNTFAFTLGYKAGDTAISSLSQAITQCSTSTGVDGGAPSATIIPSVMVSDFTYGKQSVETGEVFTANLSSYNTSSVTGISSVKTTVTLPETLTIAGGSNSVMTANVAAGGTFSNDFTLMAQPSAETGIANITVNYSFYVAGQEMPLESSQIITVSVVQPDRFSFSSIDVPDEIFIGEENTISAGFVNKGKGILYNVSAEISGNIKNPGQSQYLGNLQPGTEGSVDFMITSDTVGVAKGIIKITYEDIAGTQKTQEKQYSVTLTENMYAGDDFGVDGGMVGGYPDGEPLPEEAVGIPSFVKFGGFAVVAVGGFIAYKKVKARKEAQRLAELEEEYEVY